MEIMEETGILKSGDLLGKYRILRLLGSWGIADIYETEKIISGHHAVLKVLSPEFIENKNNTFHPQKKIVDLNDVPDQSDFISGRETEKDHGYYFYPIQMAMGKNLRRRLKRNGKSYNSDQDIFNNRHETDPNLHQPPRNIKDSDKYRNKVLSICALFNFNNHEGSDNNVSSGINETPGIIGSPETAGTSAEKSLLLWSLAGICMILLLINFFYAKGMPFDLFMNSSLNQAKKSGMTFYNIPARPLAQSSSPSPLPRYPLPKSSLPSSSLTSSSPSSRTKSDSLSIPAGSDLTGSAVNFTPSNGMQWLKPEQISVFKHEEFKYLTDLLHRSIDKKLFKAAKQYLVAAGELFPDSPGYLSNVEEYRRKLQQQSRIKKLSENFVWIKGGNFQMGCNSHTDQCDSDEKPVHKVILNGFWMEKCEVTTYQYMRCVKEGACKLPEWLEKGGKYNINTGKDKYYKRLGKSLTEKNHPITGISWYDAKAFAIWLSQKTGYKYRLPTEAEWEYAARNRGRNIKFCWGNKDPYINGKKAANIADETAGAKYSLWTVWKGYNDGYIYTSPVGNFAPNGLGLYDMGGNVWEWCEDVYNKNAYKHHSIKNPLYTGKNSYRVIRGGSWYNDPQNTRCTNRYFRPPDKRNLDVGFRLVTGDIKLP